MLHLLTLHKSSRHSYDPIYLTFKLVRNYPQIDNGIRLVEKDNITHKVKNLI